MTFRHDDRLRGDELRCAHCGWFSCMSVPYARHVDEAAAAHDVSTPHGQERLTRCRVRYIQESHQCLRRKLGAAELTEYERQLREVAA